MIDKDIIKYIYHILYFTENKEDNIEGVNKYEVKDYKRILYISLK